MASATPDLRLPSQLQSVTVLWPISNYTAWSQRHTGVSSLPQATTWWRRPGLKPATCESQVRCPTRSATTSHTLMIHSGCNYLNSWTTVLNKQPTGCAAQLVWRCPFFREILLCDQEFTTVHARLQVSVCSSYDLCHPGQHPDTSFWSTHM